MAIISDKGSQMWYKDGSIAFPSLRHEGHKSSWLCQCGDQKVWLASRDLLKFILTAASKVPMLMWLQSQGRTARSQSSQSPCGCPVCVPQQVRHIPVSWYRTSKLQWRHDQDLEGRCCNWLNQVDCICTANSQWLLLQMTQPFTLLRFSPSL